MGYGAYMKVTNNSSSPLMLFVNDVICMYDNGQEGSNLSLFNNTTVAGNSTLPGGGGQYIEVKASGSCFFEDSSFTLKIEDSLGNLIGNVAFTESDNNWSGTADNPDVIDLNINNSGDQARITVTVENISG